MKNAPSPHDESRILIFSQRNINRLMYQCYIYEFEDVIRSVDQVDLLAPSSTSGSEIRQTIHRMGNGIRKLASMLPEGDIAPITITKDYDLFFTALQFPWQLIYLKKLKDWRKRCKQTACFLAEMWTPWILKDKQYLSLLADMDHIFTHSEVSAQALSAHLGRKCYCLPFGVDTQRFAPASSWGERAIDVLSIGRSSPKLHQDLLALSQQDEFFYHFDTARQFQVSDYREHRIMFAELLKRSRFFLAYKHNLNMSQLTGGDEALGPRFFEGAASGTVLLGAAPECGEYTSSFDWPDALIPLPYEPEDIGGTLARLSADPDRLAEARRNNVANSLLRHDWAYRWGLLLETAGIKSSPAMDVRTNQLSQRARDVWAGGGIEFPGQAARSRADERKTNENSSSLASIHGF